MTTTRPVILCGGAGTRLWPLSREEFPKQLLALGDERTLLQHAALRQRHLRGADGQPADAALVVCSEAHRFLVADQLARCGANGVRYLLEPCARGTAPALTLAAVDQVVHGDPVLVAMPSDHLIAGEADFARAMREGVALAGAGHLVAFGVPPNSPATGYGYIRAGQGLGRPDAPHGRVLEDFVEKPDVANATAYQASGRYLWNCGIFAVRASVWIECIAALRKEIFSACERARRLARCEGPYVQVERGAFESCPVDSIDYAVMERVCRPAPGGLPVPVSVVTLEARWSDVGAWNALWDLAAKDRDGNVIQGDVQATGTRNALLIAQHRLLACVGLDDVVVVETPDAVMVARKDRAQDVRQVVARLREAGRAEAQVPRKVRRPWGSYDSLDGGERFQVKRLSVDPGAALSLQMHYHRAEHWVVVRGTARVTRGDEQFLLEENHSTYIPMGVRHRLENPGHVPLEIIEVQSGAYLGEDDIVRFDDRYGRVPAPAPAPRVGGRAAESSRVPDAPGAGAPRVS